MRAAACVLLLLAATGLTAEPLRLAVIAHRSVPVDTLEKGQLLDYYACDIQRWPNGDRVVVTDLGEKGVVRDGFYKFLGTRASRMKSIWLRKMLSGEGDPPHAVPTEAEMVRRVARTPGALGFVRQASVTDSVRVLLWIHPDSSAPLDAQ